MLIGAHSTDIGDLGVHADADGDPGSLALVAGRAQELEARVDRSFGMASAREGGDEDTDDSTAS